MFHTIIFTYALRLQLSLCLFPSQLYPLPLSPPLSLILSFPLPTCRWLSCCRYICHACCRPRGSLQEMHKRKFSFAAAAARGSFSRFSRFFCFFLSLVVVVFFSSLFAFLLLLLPLRPVKIKSIVWGFLWQLLSSGKGKAPNWK